MPDGSGENEPAPNPERVGGTVAEPAASCRWLARIGISVGLGLALTGCTGSSPTAGTAPEHGGQEHEVFCMGRPAKCDGTAAAFCESRYGSGEFVLVRRVPERGALVIACSAE